MTTKFKACECGCKQLIPVLPDPLTPEQVFERVIEFLKAQSIGEDWSCLHWAKVLEKKREEILNNKKENK